LWTNLPKKCCIVNHCNLIESVQDCHRYESVISIKIFGSVETCLNTFEHDSSATMHSLNEKSESITSFGTKTSKLIKCLFWKTLNLSLFNDLHKWFFCGENTFYSIHKKYYYPHFHVSIIRDPGSISSMFYTQLLPAQIPNVQKRLTTWLSFCAFGICVGKSCS